jgi:hypothetical protein
MRSMRVLEVLILVLLVGMLGFGVYVLWLNLPGEPIEYEEFSAELGFENGNGAQFYPNMRYRTSENYYYVDSDCSEKKKSDVNKAFGILAEETVLTFYSTNDVNVADIEVLCSEIAPQPDKAGHFVAGEGGPSEVINNTVFSVILKGEISLFRDDKCGEPMIALHEALHALGFDHNNNKKSIMYPTTSCDQELDAYIIDKINSLYGVESRPDLVVSSVDATKSGRYLGFEVAVINVGLDDSISSVLTVVIEGDEVWRRDMGKVEIGTRKVLTVENVRVPRTFDSVSFIVETEEEEIDKGNNVARVGVA